MTLSALASTVFGVVNGYDTSTFTEGAPLYLSTSGALTDVMPDPVGTALIVNVGYALNSTNNGKVLVAGGSSDRYLQTAELYDPVAKIPIDSMSIPADFSPGHFLAVVKYPVSIQQSFFALLLR